MEDPPLAPRLLPMAALPPLPPLLLLLPIEPLLLRAAGRTPCMAPLEPLTRPLLSASPNVCVAAAAWLLPLLCCCVRVATRAVAVVAALVGPGGPASVALGVRRCVELGMGVGCSAAQCSDDEWCSNGLGRGWTRESKPAPCSACCLAWHGLMLQQGAQCEPSGGGTSAKTAVQQHTHLWWSGDLCLYQRSQRESAPWHLLSELRSTC